MIIKVIIGPTASGKSALAVERAGLDNGTIINADAMQCYNALPILTAQPDNNEQKNIPHRLYGVLDASGHISAAEWATMAKTEIETAHKNGQTPYIVGGTGLYIKALMEGLSPIPDIPDEIRNAVRSRIHTSGLAAIYAELQERDPAMAEKLKAGDTQRILRAMEVLEATGQSLAEWQRIPAIKPPAGWQFHVTAINPPKDVLDTKIRTRLRTMLNSGARAEIETLSNRIDAGEIPANAPVTIAHGFKNYRKVLKGQMSEDEAFEATAIETRQYTKRQRTWLRHQITASETLG